MAKTTSINLLRSKESHLKENLIKWAFSTLRFLIILTETIALSAFVYRFTLDREIIDLSDSISNKQLIVEAFHDQEVKYRNIHERLATAKVLAAEENTKAEFLKQLVTLAKGKVTFQKVTISATSFSLEVATSSPGGLQSFLTNVKTLKGVKSVSVSRVENRASNGVIIVTVSGAFFSSGKEEPNGTQQ